MGYKIDYASREKDTLLQILDCGRHLSDIKVSQNIAQTLHQELKDLYGELCDCLQALEEGIRRTQTEIRQAEQALQTAQRQAEQAKTQLQMTPTTKTVNPTREEAANGAKPKQVPANQEKIAKLKAEIAGCQAEVQHQQQITKDQQARLELLEQDQATLKQGADRVEDYLKIAEEACTRLETAYREAEFRCTDRILPDIEKIAHWMEQYDDVQISPCAGISVPLIQAKEGW